ncbi:MAG: sigma-70 family RNA polymerase sigma factor [Candidatus Wallbacteria bacterium]|nr:sigma-70 family RNA polymerase sigma factor [Candidatus Wallbacteria bacterium]
MVKHKDDDEQRAFTNPFRALLKKTGGTPWPIGRGQTYPELTAAQQRLVEGFYEKARKMGSKAYRSWAHCGEADVIGAALEGLVIAAQRYRPGKVNFSFVARLYIHKAILEFYRTSGHVIRLPWREKRHEHPVCDIQPLVDVVPSAHGHDVTSFVPVSWRQASAPIQKALASLSEGDRDVIWCVVVLGETPTDVGRTLGVSRQQVNVIVRRSLRRLRETVGPGLLRGKAVED